MKPILNSTRHPWAAYPVLLMLGACSGGAVQSSYLPAASVPRVESAPSTHSRTTTGFVYVSNVTEKGSSQLLVVYPAGTANPSPTRTVTKGLVDVQGVTVDPAGNVYVANGSGRNVLEFGPGGAPLMQTYSAGLVHPDDMTVANGTVYVADQGSAANGYAQQIWEYPVGNRTPSLAIAGPGASSQRNQGIAVDPLAFAGTFFVAASTIASVPRSGACPTGSNYIFAENLLPTLWEKVPLSNNQQAWGVAFDAAGTLYVSDICADVVATYSGQDYQWTYTGNVPGHFATPAFLSVNNQMLAVANARSSAPGYVTVVDLTGATSTVTITDGLHMPIGAAVGPAPLTARQILTER